MAAGVVIRPYEPGDDDALYDVCLRTGAPGGVDASGLHDDERLLGEIYVGPYLWHAPDLAFVAEDDGGIGGYVLGVTDTVVFESACEASWWPALRRRYLLPDPADTSPDARLARHIHAPPLAGPDVASAYPAHLHIDLLPRLQGKRLGRPMLSTLFDALVAAGVDGVHLGVGITNERAIGFYLSMGFGELQSSTTTVVMGLRIPPRS